LSEVQEEIVSLGTRVVLISPELRVFSTALKEEAQSTYPILADIDNGYALSINLAIWVDEAMSELIAGSGWDIPQYTGNRSWLLPIPATYMVDSSGVIRSRFVDPDYRRRVDLDELKRAIQSINAPHSNLRLAAG
jgi:peroxiredoxin